MTDQPLNLDEIEARLNAATSGPWHLTDADAIVAPLTAEKVADVWEPSGVSRNGEFIENARTDVEALVAEIRRLRTQKSFLIEQLRRKDAASGEADRKAREFLGSEPTNQDFAAVRGLVAREALEIASAEAERLETGNQDARAARGARSVAYLLRAFAEGVLVPAAGELERRAQVVQSFRELAAQAREDGDYEGEASVLSRLKDREQQWARIDAAEFPDTPPAVSPAV